MAKKIIRVKKKMKTYTTYARLFYKGKPQGRKYVVRVKARDKANAVKRAKAYHASWNKGEKKRGGEYSGKYAGIKE